MEQKRNNHLLFSPDFYSRIEIKEIYKYSEERDILNYVRRFSSLFLSFDAFFFDHRRNTSLSPAPINQP